jgi:hypothetical protein
MKTEDKENKKAEDAILEHLLHNNSLTTKEAESLFFTTELRTYISRIVKRGYNVAKSRIKVLRGDGKKASVVRYSIPKVF